MTKQRRFKQRVRERMDKTGERYAAARRGLLSDFDQPGEPGDRDTALSETQFSVADERVRDATGRGRDEWFALLDAADGSRMSHSQIAALLADEHGLAGWWGQTVAVDYELARGLRDRHQRPDGFEISKSKTIAAPVDDVYRAWADPEQRAQWLDAEIEVTSMRANQSLRGRFGAGPTRVAVSFIAKSEVKTQVTVAHSKLADRESAERAKQDWAGRLEQLAQRFG